MFKWLKEIDRYTRFKLLIGDSSEWVKGPYDKYLHQYKCWNVTNPSIEVFLPPFYQVYVDYSKEV